MYAVLFLFTCVFFLRVRVYGWVGRSVFVYVRVCVCAVWLWLCVCACERERVRLRVRVCMPVWKFTTDLLFPTQFVQATGQTESDRLKLTEKLAPKLEEALGNPISSLQVRVYVVSLWIGSSVEGIHIIRLEYPFWDCVAGIHFGSETQNGWENFGKHPKWIPPKWIPIFVCGSV